MFSEVCIKCDMIFRRGAIMHDAHCGSMVFTHEVVPTLSAGLRAGALTQRSAKAPVTPVVRRLILMKCRFHEYASYDNWKNRNL